MATRPGAPDIPTYGEGESEEEAIADLKVALGAYVEAFSLDGGDFRSGAPV